MKGHVNSTGAEETDRMQDKSQDNTVVKEKNPLPFSFRFGNLQGVGAREKQEDSFAFSNVFDASAKDGGILAVIADGMGGLQNGKTASETAVSVIRDGFAAINYDDNIPNQLINLVRLAGERVEEAVQGKGGSTLVSVVILKDQLYFASLGDSYLFLRRGEYLTRLNRFHTVLTDARADLISDGVMDPDDVILDDNPSALTEFLGKNPIQSIDSFAYPLKLRVNDVVLLCTDGIGGSVKNSAIYQALSNNTPTQMCMALETLVKNQNSRYQDNYTALVIQCAFPE